MMLMQMRFNQAQLLISGGSGGVDMRSFWMLAYAVFFACAAICVRYASASLTVFELMMWRSLLMSSIIGVWALATRKSFRAQCPLLLSVRCALGSLSVGLWFWSVTLLPLATASCLHYTSPLHVAAFTVTVALVRRSAIPYVLLSAALVGFAGVSVMYQPDFSQSNWWCELVALGSGFVSALSSIFIRALACQREPVWRIVFWCSLCAALVGAFLQWIFFGTFSAITSEAVWAVLLMGVMALLTQLAFTAAFSSRHLVLSSVLQYLAVVTAVVFGFSFFGELPQMHEWLGMAIVCAAGLMATVAVIRSQNATGAARTAAGEPLQERSGRLFPAARS